MEILNENLRQPFDTLQSAACSALRQLLYVYFASSATVVQTSIGADSVLATNTPITPTSVLEGSADTPVAPVVSAGLIRIRQLTTEKYIEGLLTEENVAVTRGYALAIGALPVSLAVHPDGRFPQIVSCLSHISSSDFLICGEPDSATRCNAVQSLVELFEKVYPFAPTTIGGSIPTLPPIPPKSGSDDVLESALLPISPVAEGCRVMGQALIGACMDVLFTACRDYTVDKVIKPTKLPLHYTLYTMRSTQDTPDTCNTHDTHDKCDTYYTH